MKSRISFEEILDDFKSLEDLASNVTFTNGHKETENDPEVMNTGMKDEAYLQLQDFRRPKPNEPKNCSNRFRKMNRSYSMREFKKQGFQLKSLQRKDSQQKIVNSSFLLSEFIL